jgi:predicted transposase YbfD/YdcC
LPVEGNPEALKRTNEIKMAIPLLEAIDITGKDLTTDALLTQRELAHYLVARGAYYHFTVKGNQPTLLQDLIDYFQNRQAADFVEISPPDHGRIETRRIWTTTALNNFVDFPHLAQAYLIERESMDKKTGEHTRELAYGITSTSTAVTGASRAATGSLIGTTTRTAAASVAATDRRI